MSLIDYIEKGGTINWVLVALLFATLTIALERAVYFFQTRGLKSEKLGQENLFFKPSQAQRISHLDRVHNSLSHESRQHLLEPVCIKMTHEMERGLWLITFISACAPSLGLLGTVVGLIKSFQTMAGQANLDIAALSGGIWEAMLTTACGMIVAIIAMFFSRIFRQIIAIRSTQMDLAMCYNFCEDNKAS